MSNKLRLEKIKALAKSIHLGVMDDDIRWLIERVEQLQKDLEESNRLVINWSKKYGEVKDRFEQARKSYLQACEELEAHAHNPKIVLSIVEELKQALEKGER
jgi:hypothetical protein